MLNIAFAFLVSLIISLVLMPFVIALSKKLKFKQTILHYVDKHSAKSGTPTMGGIGFILASVIASLIFMTTENSLTLICVIVTVGYGIVGFLDDFIKIIFKQNKGLSAYQKIIFQVVIAVIVSIFAYYNPFVGDSVYVPFTFVKINIGYLAIAFYVVIFLAYTNAVNLTDGLDGLASNVTLIYMVANAIIIYLAIYLRGDGQAFVVEYQNLLVFCGAVVGSLIGFNCFNGYPAKVFMGDTGSLALGGAVGSLAVVSSMSLYSPIVGIMYVLTCLSVAMQVLYYKKTKKRIFLMAPLHHHYEQKGIHENRIVASYVAITCFMGSACIILTLLFA